MCGGGKLIESVFSCRDVKEEEETTPWAEQQNWESEQIKKASMRVGSKDKARKEYDLVFEDQIDFIMDKVEIGDIEVNTNLTCGLTASVANPSVLCHSATGRPTPVPNFDSEPGPKVASGFID